MPTNKPPKVVLEPTQVRDYQRRMRLVMNLLIEEINQRTNSPTKENNTQNKQEKVLIATQENNGGKAR